MRPKGMKLSPRHLTWLYSVFSVLYLSGLLWIFLHYFFHYRSEMGEPHPFEPLSLKIHGAAAMLALIMLGTLIPIHMKRGWAAKMNRGNGMILIGANLLLILTGYALYYAGKENLRLWSCWVHSILGILFPVFLVWHIIEGRKSRLKALKRNHPPKKIRAHSNTGTDPK